MEPKMNYLCILETQFWNNFFIFDVKTFELLQVQSFAQKHKSLNMGPKMSYLGIFRIQFWKTNVIFAISILKFVKVWFRNKNLLILLPKMPSLGIFGLHLKKVNHIWNQNPQIFQNEKIVANQIRLYCGI